MKKAHRNVNEESVAYITASFYSKTGQLATPSSVRYRLDDITRGLPGTSILDWTAVSVSATSYEFMVTAEQNSIMDSCNATESKQLTVEATGTDGEPWREVFEYQVVNLAGTS